MIFNSLTFVLFIILFYIVWFFVKSRKGKINVLVISSLIFYGWWDARFLLLIIASGLIDFYASLAIRKYQRHKRIFLILSLVSNLSILFFFKYFNFLLMNIFSFLGFIGYEDISFSHMTILLPVGISFYTFQSMSYTIDVYKDELEPTRNLSKFFAYLTMFPQLVAGPIVRAKDIMFQLDGKLETTEEERFSALLLIVRGFSKKMLIADNIAPYVNKAFTLNNFAVTSIDWWLIALGFTFQIYFDFSGYSDIAIGIARSIGIKFNKNFDYPYISKSLSEFWGRWHISLSSWFRDYVYIPLGGNRSGYLKSYTNIMITMMLSGLWHGASWNFVLWGGFHGLFLIFEKLAKNFVDKLHWFVRWTLIMQVVIIGWVIFRCSSMTELVSMLKKMYLVESFKMTLNREILFFLVLGGIWEIWCYFKLTKYLIPYKGFLSICLAVMVFLTIILRGAGQDFIYFQF